MFCFHDSEHGVKIAGPILCIISLIMDLILWRHAEAEEGLFDLNRELTKHGRQQAQHMAEWLIKRLSADARILVSPATRTQQTASALTSDFITQDALAPGADAQSVIDAAGWPNAGGTVVIVGHQPTLGEVAAKLLAHSDHGWSIKKGAIWWLVTRKPGNGETQLKAAITPELL
jgi:phosphohistidine phosphatase